MREGGRGGKREEWGEREGKGGRGGENGEGEWKEVCRHTSDWPIL